MSATEHEAPETFDILRVGRRVAARRRRRRGAQVATGLLLIGAALRRSPPLGLALGIAGATLALRGFTGKRLGTLIEEMRRRLGGQRPGRGTRKDIVDVGSMLSFPASDPPAYPAY